ncbi:MAG: glycosyltransferase family protein [Bacteroidales bacterium]
MKYIFIVQGEGRGHMTQAISLKNMLVKNGHDVSAVIVGKSPRRNIPSFFYQKINTKVLPVDSPNFVIDKKNKKIRITKSILYSLLHASKYLKSIKTIQQVIRETNPDAIINFYDLLGGLFYLFNNPKIPYYCIGHQYLVFHPDFSFPPKHRIDRFLLKLNTRITSFRADRLLALSFHEMSDCNSKKISVVPPLLRKSVLELKPKNEGFIHGYILNQGYAEDIINWHKNNPNFKAHFFWDKKDAEEETIIHRNLIFHKINDEKFLDYMSRCQGYASTAGFESICEAMYLGKPVLMVPTEGHYEQKCNALDATLSGAGIQSDTFNITKLLQYIPKHNNNHPAFKQWVRKADILMPSILSAEEKPVNDVRRHKYISTKLTLKNSF